MSNVNRSSSFQASSVSWWDDPDLLIHKQIKIVAVDISLNLHLIQQT